MANADRHSIEKARTAIQRSRDLLALANYLRPEIKRKSSRLERDDFSEARARFQPLLQVIPCELLQIFIEPCLSDASRWKALPGLPIFAVDDLNDRVILVGHESMSSLALAGRS